MRPVALGRKNWIHIGSPQAGPKIAAILSVVESCRTVETPGARLFSSDSSRACRCHDPASSGTYSRSLGLSPLKSMLLFVVILGNPMDSIVAVELYLTAYAIR